MAPKWATRPVDSRIESCASLAFSSSRKPSVQCGAVGRNCTPESWDGAAANPANPKESPEAARFSSVREAASSASTSTFCGFGMALGSSGSFLLALARRESKGFPMGP